MLQQNPRNHHSRLSHNHSHRSYSHHQPTTVAMPMPPPGEQSQSSDNDRSSGELRALDCNLTSLCDHIQSEGFNNGAFSDIVIHAMGSTYHLHRLVMSRSSYFRNMLHGPWKEATAPVVKLQLDDKNVNGEAIALALAYLYGHHPKLNDNNAFRVLAAASFLDLEDLCAICTDFIISELWTSNFLTYQVFAENQDYGRYGDRVRNACWGYLCQCGSMELKEILPKLSSQTLHALLTSNDLWVLSEEKRFELALYTFLKKGKVEHQERCGASVEKGIGSDEDLTHTKGKNVMNSNVSRCPETDTAHVHQIACAECQPRTRSPSRVQPSPMTNPFSDTDDSRSSSSYVDMPGSLSVARQCCSGASIEGPSEETLCCQFSNCSWLTESDLRHCSFSNTSCDLFMASEWGSYDIRVPWGGRIVGRRQIKGYAGDNGMMTEEEFNTFNNIFEGGLLLYCNMSFEALLNARKLQEELGFPCKAVNDGLWLQMLLSQRVQEIAADTCKNCCLLGMACACRQPFAFSHGVATAGYYAQKPDQLSTPGNVGNLYVADSAQGEGNNNVVRPVRVHVRGSNDGLAVIGRAHTHVPGNAWPPTRFVFSRVPFGVGNNRNGQQSLANDDLDARGDQNADLSGDGLTALVGLSEGGRNMSIVHGGQTERDQEIDLPNEMLVSAVAGPSGSQTGITEPPDDLVTESHWENSDNASISLDLKTPLSHFPPFRFGVEFQDVHRLSDGQVKHSPEAFYAGSLWKVSVQAFSDEDPQGRRTLGLFIHRRKAEIADPLRKVHMYVDSREKVTARYQLICPSKRDVMVFGSFKQAGTLLPKAPKGWGWRSALLYDELPDMLQNGCLRVSAVVQLV